jgi:4-hydroxybenzoate polyprenyltransferase
MGSLATRRVSFWRTALKLGRVSNLPTVWSNVIAATVLAGGASLQLGAMLAVAISLMYVGGMYLNDAFDKDIDARERPERPIPAGEITAEAVYIGGFALLGVGMLALASINGRAGLAGVALAAAIVVYNWHHKGNLLAPFVMGLCRALVYVAAAVAVSATLPTPVLLGGAATLAYVAGLTYAARMEGLDRIGTLWPLLMLVAPLAVTVSLTGSISMPLVIAVVAFIAAAVRIAQLLMRRGPGDISRAVALLIAGIAINDALLASTTGVDHAAYACLACFVLTLFFQRYVAGT